MEKKLQQICYILQFIDSARFMASSLSTLINYITEGVHRIKFIVSKRCLSWWIYGSLGKIQCNIISRKKDFHSHLNMEGITDADYAHAKKICKNFEINGPRKYHDLHVQSDTLLLADEFENFRYMCLKIHQLDPAKFLSAPGLAWQAALKKG